MVASLAALNDCQVSKKAFEVYKRHTSGLEGYRQLAGDVVDFEQGNWLPVKGSVQSSKEMISISGKYLIYCGSSLKMGGSCQL